MSIQAVEITAKLRLRLRDCRHWCIASSTQSGPYSFSLTECLKGSKYIYQLRWRDTN